MIHDLRDEAAEDLLEIERACRVEVGAVEAIRCFCAFSRDVDPHPIWDEIAALPVEEDLDGLEARLRAVLKAEPIPASVKFLHFGMFEGCDAGESLCTDARVRFYVAGHSVFDEEDPGEGLDNAWWPEGRYLDSDTLATISRMGYVCSSLYLMDTFLLACASAIARELTRRVSKELLAGVGALHLGVCHDDGDMLLLGRWSGGSGKGAGARFEVAGDGGARREGVGPRARDSLAGGRVIFKDAGV